jgi:stage V sporulation protein R
MRLKSDLPAELKYNAVVIEAAARDAGLDFFDVVFELLDARDVNGVAAYGGFPVRYPSWRFGMDFERLQKGHQWGLSKIYELVINNDPTYAYLVRSNSLLEQKLVMAHVYGHADFFKNNVWFEPTERKMLDRMGQHSTRVRRMIDAMGVEEVERVLDSMLSVETLIDPYLPRRLWTQSRISDREALSDRRRRSLERFGLGDPSPQVESVTHDPSASLPTYDVLGFLEEHAPLKPWERELMSIVRQEAYYFAPQRTTKVINEGWACHWHSKLLTGGLLEPSEIVDFADTHAGATAAAPGQLNPYRLGLRLLRYAEERGKDLFLLRRIHNDVTLIDELMDEEFVMRCFGIPRGAEDVAREQGLDWQAFKAKLLGDLAWGGLPRIELVGVDASGVLQLEHRHDGRDLQLSTASETMRNLERLWRAPVTLETQVEERPKRFTVREGRLETEDLSEPVASDSEELVNAD